MRLIINFGLLDFKKAFDHVESQKKNLNFFFPTLLRIYGICTYSELIIQGMNGSKLRLLNLYEGQDFWQPGAALM